MTGRKRQSRRLASARAYYRLAWKRENVGRRQGDIYRRKADRLVEEDRRIRERNERAAKERAERQRARLAAHEQEGTK